MCRMCALISDESVLLADILLRPRMSLVHQSYAARERRQLPQGEMPKMAYQQPFLNADGFGVGWYGQQGCAPCVFTSLKPAWSDPNLRNLAQEVRSSMIFAHIRAAGPCSSVTEDCCHPFKAGRILFAHNGLIGHFDQIRREILAGLSDYAFSVAMDHGCIDSAVAFAVFLTELGVTNEDAALEEHSADSMTSALARTVERLSEASARFGEEESLLNLMVTDGQRVIACRFCTAPCKQGCIQIEDEEQQWQDVGATLYLSVGSRWAASPDDPQSYRMKKGADIKCCTAILSSEPLTSVREEWLPIAPNTIVVCGRTRGHCRSIDTLMFPLRSGPPVGLSALQGVESIPQRKDSEDAKLAHSVTTLANQNALQKSDVWMTISGCSEDVNCVTALSEHCIAAGSMDGTLRFFDTSTGGLLAARRHSEASGPVLSLLFLGAQSISQTSVSLRSPCAQQQPSRKNTNDSTPPVSERQYPQNSRGAASPPPTERKPSKIRLKLSESGSMERAYSADDLLDLAAHESNSPLTSTCRELLLSSSNNEMRIWDTSSLREGTMAVGESLNIPCLWCMRFSPNQGQLLSMAGNFNCVFLGFQSANLFRLGLKEFLSEFEGKMRSKTTKHYTFRIDDSRTSVCPGSSTASAANRLPRLKLKLPQKTFELLQTGESQHMGFIHCATHNSTTGVLASGGGDGRIIFWSENGKPCSTFLHGGAVFALSSSSCSSEIFSGDAHGRIRVWDCNAVKHGSRSLLMSPDHISPAILALAVITLPSVGQRDTVLLLAGHVSGMIRIWDSTRSLLLRELCPSMTCCATLCGLGSPVQMPNGNWLLRLASGGDTTGKLRLAQLEVMSSESQCNVHSSLGSKELSKQIRKPSSGCLCASDAQGVEFQRMITLLAEFISIPTLPSNPCSTNDRCRATSWLAQQFEQLVGATVRISNECIIARCGWDESKPLVVLYSHYDVVAPGEGWSTNPWEMTASDGYFYGRGVSDNKGPLLAQIFAVRRLRQTMKQAFFLSGLDSPAEAATSETEGCPVNVLFVADGHEEEGACAPVLRLLQEARKDGWLRGKIAGLLGCNSQWIDDETPCLCYGKRGVVDLELSIQAGHRDLHSGQHGGLIAEPMFDLMALVSSLTDHTGVPSVPGLLEGVGQPSKEDQANLEAAAKCIPKDFTQARFGLESYSGPAWLNAHQQPGLEALRRIWLQPSITVTEVGTGPKHLHGRHIASRASCVVSVRTARGQRHQDVEECIKRHLLHEFAKRRSTNKLQFSKKFASDCWEASTESSVFQAARAGMATAWRIDPSAVLAVREGGTMAVIPPLQAELGCDAVELAFTQASASVHLPNERVSRTMLEKAVEAISETLACICDNLR